MNEHDILAELRQARDELDDIIRSFEVPDPRDGLNILGRIRQSFNGWPRSSGFGGSTAPSATDSEGEPMPGHADPTGDGGTRPDPAADDLRIIGKQAVVIRRANDLIKRTSFRYVLRTPNAIDQKESAANDEPGCDSCARVPSPGTVGKPKTQQTPWFNRVDLVTKLADGTPVSLCDWCWRGPVGVKHTGDLPAERHVAMHRDGKRVLNRSA